MSSSVYELNRYDMAGFEVAGKRLEDGRIQLGVDGDGRIIENWSVIESATPKGGYPVYNIEGVQKIKDDEVKEYDRKDLPLDDPEPGSEIGVFC